MADTDATSSVVRARAGDRDRARALLLHDLPAELVQHVFTFLDLVSLGRLAQASCALLRAGTAKVSPRSALVPAPLLQHEARREGLQVRLAQTQELRVTNSQQAACKHSGRFCKLCPWELVRASGHAPPPAQPPGLLTTCGSLLDAGLASVLNAAPKLRTLDLTAMGHLSASALLHALSACQQLEVLCCRGCAPLVAVPAVRPHPRAHRPPAPPRHA